MAVQSLCFRISSPPCSPLNQMASPASLYLMPSSYSTSCRRRVNRHRLAGLATLIWLADNILDFRHRIACHPIRCHLLPTHSRLSSYQQTFLTLHMPHCAHSTTHDRSLPQWPPTAYSVHQRHQTTAAYTRTRNQHKHCTITLPCVSHACVIFVQHHTSQQDVPTFAINVLVVTNGVNSKAILYTATLLSSILVPCNYIAAFRRHWNDNQTHATSFCRHLNRGAT